MGLTVSSFWQRLFGKKSMRILMGKPALISHVREPQNSLWVKDTSVEKFIVGCFSSLVLFCVPSNCFIVCVQLVSMQLERPRYYTKLN